MGKSKWQPGDQEEFERERKRVDLTDMEKESTEGADRPPVRGLIRFVLIVLAFAVASLFVIGSLSQSPTAEPAARPVLVVSATPDFQATTIAKTEANATAAAADLAIMITQQAVGVASVNDNIVANATRAAGDLASISESVNQNVSMNATLAADEIAAVSADVTRVSEQINLSLSSMATIQAEDVERVSADVATLSAGVAAVGTIAAGNADEAQAAATAVGDLRADMVTGLFWLAGVLFAFAAGGGIVALFRRPPVQIPHVFHSPTPAASPSPAPIPPNVADNFFAGVRSGQDVTRLAGIVRQNWPEFPNLPRPGGKSELWRRSWPRFSRSEDPPPHLGGSWYSMMNEAIEHIYSVTSSTSSTSR